MRHSTVSKQLLCFILNSTATSFFLNFILSKYLTHCASLFLSLFLVGIDNNVDEARWVDVVNEVDDSQQQLPVAKKSNKGELKGNTKEMGKEKKSTKSGGGEMMTSTTPVIPLDGDEDDTVSLSSILIINRARNGNSGGEGTATNSTRSNKVELSETEPPLSSLDAITLTEQNIFYRLRATTRTYDHDIDDEASGSDNTTSFTDSLVLPTWVRRHLLEKDEEK